MICSGQASTQRPSPPQTCGRIKVEKLQIISRQPCSHAFTQRSQPMQRSVSITGSHFCCRAAGAVFLSRDCDTAWDHNVKACGAVRESSCCRPAGGSSEAGPAGRRGTRHIQLKGLISESPALREPHPPLFHREKLPVKAMTALPALAGSPENEYCSAHVWLLEKVSPSGVSFLD